MKILIMAMILIVGTFVAPVQAVSCDGTNHVHNPQKMAEMYFSQMGLNGDGTVNKSEFEKSKISQLIKSFDMLKPGVDGLVDKTAFIQAFIKVHSKPRTEV